MLYAKNGVTDAEIRQDEQEHMDLEFLGLGRKNHLPDLGFARAPRFTVVLPASMAGVEGGRGG